jgi:molybdopterin molybdotransferase
MKNTDPKEPSGCDEMASSLIPVDEAKARILASVNTVQGSERVAIRSSLNRILTEDIQSTINVPPYDNSAMDGYAIQSSDIPSSGETTLKVVGESFAGKPYHGKVNAGECIRIMTGAMIAEGTDTVIMQEQASREGDHITIGSQHKKNENVRYAGEDMKVGQTVMSPGKKITPSELGLLASLGIPEVSVSRKVRVAFFSTGDELRGVGETLEEGQIYDSNRYTLYGMLKRLNIDLIDMGVIRDDRDAIRDAFHTASTVADAIITSGGVSVGEADFVKQTLDEIGQVNFWRVAMKPGKPLAIGHINDAFFFGLPGNPVSAMATFYQFVQPALQKLMGQDPGMPLLLKVPCKTTLKKKPGRLEYQRGLLSYNENGELQVHTTGKQGSHVLTSMSNANCFIILPAENSGVSEGELVEVQPFAGVI